MKIYEVNKGSLVTHLKEESYDDEYGSYRTRVIQVTEQPGEDEYGFYIINDKRIERLTPAMKLITGYRNYHKIHGIDNSNVIGEMELGSLVVNIPYNPDILHISELRPLDVFRFYYPVKFVHRGDSYLSVKSHTYDSEDDYIFYSNTAYDFKFVCMNSNIFIVGTHFNVFVKKFGRAKFVYDKSN